MKIFIYISQPHVGGSDTYIRNIHRLFVKKYPTTEFIENAHELHHLVNWRNDQKAVLLNLSYPKDLLVVILLWILRVPTINIVHGLWFLESKSMNPRQSNFDTIFYWLSQYLICIFSVRNVVVCEYEKKNAIKYFPSISTKLVLIPGAADSNIFKMTRNSKKNVRNSLNLPLKTKILIVVSRIERRKALETTLYAMRKVIHSHANIQLLIIFPSSCFNQMDYLEELLKLVDNLHLGGSVHFLTGLTKAQLVPYYQSADLFLMSSKDLENFSLSVIESLSSGCPVLTFNTGGTPELINQVDSRLVIENNTPFDLAEKIEWYFSLSPEQINKLKFKSASVARRYSWKKSFDAFEKLIKE